jgi:hypothetical protein
MEYKNTQFDSELWLEIINRLFDKTFAGELHWETRAFGDIVKIDNYVIRLWSYTNVGADQQWALSVEVLDSEPPLPFQGEEYHFYEPKDLIEKLCRTVQNNLHPKENQHAWERYIRKCDMMQLLKTKIENLPTNAQSY